MKLNWGYTNDGIIFDRIADRQGQTLHGQFYIGKNVIKQIAELHTDFSISLESFTNIRWATIRRRWDARKDSRRYEEEGGGGVLRDASYQYGLSLLTQEYGQKLDKSRET